MAHTHRRETIHSFFHCRSLVCATILKSNDPDLFLGTAIYVFNVVPRGTWIDVEISLDGNVVKTFSHYGESKNDQYAYNFPVFTMDSIPNGDHTVTIQEISSNTSLFLFDYAIYTYVIIVLQVSPLGDEQVSLQRNYTR